MSVLVQSARKSRRGFDVRAFVAGGAATAALIAGVVLVFGSLAAYVAFNGSPLGGAAAPGSSQVVVETGARAPALAAAALSDASGAVAREPAATTAVAPAPGASAAAADGSDGSNAATAPNEGGLASPTGSDALPGPGSTVPTTSSPDSEQALSPTSPTSPTTASGPVGNAVQGVEDTTGLNLGESTAPVTNPVDQVLGELGGGVQGLEDTLDETTGGLLNP
jgi:hypothetical protein